MSRTFYEQLIDTTDRTRAEFMQIPVLRRAVQGEVTRDEYVAFLGQAYHHVRHTVPLLMACGARLPRDKEWLRRATAEYISEETGHEEWILNDIAACGGDAEAVRDSEPLPATELMVAYAYDVIDRRNPLGFFGMVFVLEGTSVQLASQAAHSIGERLQLPASAFSYLNSHGALDKEHIQFFEGLMNRIDDPEDKAAVGHCANMFYRLYGGVFQSIGDQTQRGS
jgi:pyrroloquinoline quinone (PQQ) biosynthesis protein C